MKRMVRQALVVTAASAAMAAVAGVSSGTASASTLAANSAAGAPAAITRPANCEGQSTYFVLERESASGVFWYRGNLGDLLVTNIYMGRSFSRICI
ncbi:hypothetical protein [Actinomadura fibrosa]|uniref:Secreted protein n=1 Tax=Actinomadura fibrosa TaxID=111802 RepID=A0ABW2Y0C3_9ACTN|nr:hypothetical protein [Actinomadura fibrosa]